jgi:GYF domain 2
VPAIEIPPLASYPGVCTAPGKRVACAEREPMKVSSLATVRSAVMNSPESYYLHLAGAQQGPYTIPQIDHLLNSGLIAVETLYWCEGLDQWQPVTSLVALRKKPKRWIKPVIAAAVLLTLAVPARIFGPVIVDGWHEANQHSFTESAAYWRARDVVRSELAARKAMVEFADFDDAEVSLTAPGEARVRLRGSVTEAAGKSAWVTWDVPMHFAADDAEWTGGPAVQIATP